MVKLYIAVFFLAGAMNCSQLNFRQKHASKLKAATIYLLTEISNRLPTERLWLWYFSLKISLGKNFFFFSCTEKFWGNSKKREKKLKFFSTMSLSLCLLNALLYRSVLQFSVTFLFELSSGQDTLRNAADLFSSFSCDVTKQSYSSIPSIKVSGHFGDVFVNVVKPSAVFVLKTFSLLFSTFYSSEGKKSAYVSSL